MPGCGTLTLLAEYAVWLTVVGAVSVPVVQLFVIVSLRTSQPKTACDSFTKYSGVPATGAPAAPGASRFAGIIEKASLAEFRNPIPQCSARPAYMSARLSAPKPTPL